ncbi:MAG: hypothetical protein GX267_07560 [Fibrobacter sp.]|jgi:UDP-glucose 6-dehydrogenase|nr:hypothetical protein [Fibrobacter sp.]
MTLSRDNSVFSISPLGEKFPLPSKDEYINELKRLKALTDIARSQQKEIVVVTGEGLSTPVMAARIADSKNSNGQNSKFVIWCQNPASQNYWKTPLLNRGLFPVGSENPQISELIFDVVIRAQNLTATYNPDSLTLADCVIVDTQCNDPDNQPGELFSSETQAHELKNLMKIVGERISPYSLVLIESTTAPGITEFVAYPVLKEEFQKREIENEPLLAHTFSGADSLKEYVTKNRRLWRVGAGCNDNSRRRVRAFLKSIHPDNYSPALFDRPIESETVMMVENSYKNTLLAFFNEWSLFAERNGVNFGKVLEVIKQYPVNSYLSGSDHLF